MNSKSLLIIDDEKKLCDLLARILELEGYTVHKAYDGKTGLALLNQHEIGVVLCDVKLPDYNGIDLVALIKQQKPFVQIINLTAYGTIADSVKAMKNGEIASSWPADPEQQRLERGRDVFLDGAA